MDSATEAYTDRNLLAQLCARLAKEAGHDVRWSFDPQEPEWPVLLIALPTGQISYHIPQAERLYEPPTAYAHVAWDGHDTATKRQRIKVYLQRGWSA